MSAFDDLIKDLGDKMALNLRPDQHSSCRLVFNQGATIQIDLDSTGDKILCASTLGNVPAGAFRERVFKKALIFNGIQTRKAIFSFSAKNDELVLFQYFSLMTITGESLYKALVLQAEQIRIWVEALKNGQLPEIEDEGAKTKSGYLGMR